MGGGKKKKKGGRGGGGGGGVRNGSIFILRSLVYETFQWHRYSTLTPHNSCQFVADYIYQQRK